MLLLQQDQWLSLLTSMWNELQYNWNHEHWEMEAIGNENKDWKVLDKFGNMFESTDWEKATEGLLIHERCSLNFH